MVEVIIIFKTNEKIQFQLDGSVDSTRTKFLRNMMSGNLFSIDAYDKSAIIIQPSEIAGVYIEPAQST